MRGCRNDDYALKPMYSRVICFTAAAMSIGLSIRNIPNGAQWFHAFLAMILALMDEIWGLNGDLQQVLGASFQVREATEVISILTDYVHGENEGFAVFQDLLLLIAVFSDPMP